MKKKKLKKLEKYLAGQTLSGLGLSEVLPKIEEVKKEIEGRGFTITQIHVSTHFKVAASQS
jgi:hypothetical protein